MPIQKLSPNFEAPVGVEANAYQYNGIERVEDFGLEVSHAQFRTLDAQTGRWWQIDPMAEKFYVWSPYNSNLNNPIRYNDPKGDCPPWICGAVAGAVVEIGFQVAENYYDGKRGLDMIMPNSWTKVGISTGAGFTTGGISTINNISSRAVAFGVNRLVDGGVGTIESIAKQHIDVKEGKIKEISVTEAVVEGVVSVGMGAWGDAAQATAKEYLKDEFNNGVQAVVTGATEIQENSYQKIATATMSENSNPRNQHMASPKPQSTQPTQKPTTIPASGNRMAHPQLIREPNNY